MISASPAQAGRPVPLITSFDAHNLNSLHLVAHDLPPKSRVETQVKIKLEFANMPVAGAGTAAAHWRWLRLPFTASIKQPRFYDHGMHTVNNTCSLILIPFKKPLHPNHCYIYTLLRFAPVSQICRPLAVQSVTCGRPNAALSTTRSRQIPILPPVLLISLANPYSTCQVVVSIYRSVRASCP